MGHHFVVGETYENRKGIFHVLAIRGPMMEIAFEDGHILPCLIADQERILAQMERELKVVQPTRLTPLSKTGGTPPQWYGSQFHGFIPNDFKEDVGGTHWRCREQLGGAVTARIRSPQRYNSWSIYGRPEVHWAVAHRRIAAEIPDQSKLWARLTPTHLLYGLLLERSGDPQARHQDWLTWIAWLHSHTPSLHEMMQELTLTLRDPYDSDGFTLTPLATGFQIHSPQGSQTCERDHLPALVLAHTTAQGDQPLSLLLGSQLPKEEVLRQESGIVDTLAQLFNRLLPIYEYSPPRL